MARYSCSYFVPISLNQIGFLYDDLLSLGQFEVIKRRSDVLLLSEVPNDALFPQLVKVELFIHPPTSSELQIDLLVKNHELPLRTNNRCRQFFESVHQIITKNYQGHSLSRITA
jgi:hypothetical protein